LTDFFFLLSVFANEARWAQEIFFSKDPRGNFFLASRLREFFFGTLATERFFDLFWFSALLSALDRTTSQTSKKQKSFVGFLVVLVVDTWRCSKRNKKDLAFLRVFFLLLACQRAFPPAHWWGFFFLRTW